MSSVPLSIGTRYAVSRIIGRGGMGVVYEAFTAEGTRVAVKVLADELARSETQIARFEREARAVAGLSTPHVVKVLETGVDPHTRLPFIAMEHLEGEDLREVLKRVGKLPPDVAVRIALQACEALKQAHAADVLHRDIKPANLFLSVADHRRLVKLLDFGIAKTPEPLHRGAASESLTHTGTMIGSPQYMSPEQARGSRRLDARADLWSLGIVLYQMLCGTTPHAALDELGAMIVLICTQPPEPLQNRAPWVPREIAAIVHRALRMSPDERYGSAAEMMEALRAAAPGPTDIEEASLRAINLEEIARVADRLPEDQLRDAALPLTMDGITGSSASGASRSAAVSASRRSRSLRIGVGGLIVSGLGLLGYSALGPGERASGPDTSGTLPHRPAEVVVLVAIAPADADVRVDGSPVVVRDGFVEIAGQNGSAHVVRVAKGTTSVETSVAIADRRAVPSKVELPLASGATSPTSPMSSEPPPSPDPSTSARPSQRATATAPSQSAPATSTVPLLRPTR